MFCDIRPDCKHFKQGAVPTPSYLSSGTDLTNAYNNFEGEEEEDSEADDVVLDLGEPGEDDKHDDADEATTLRLSDLDKTDV